MKKVFIKYNPYKLETEFTVDGQILAQNSIIGERILPGTRLQEWIEELPYMLLEEYNDSDFDIVFHGTLLDYEDVSSVFLQAEERNELNVIQMQRIPAKETKDKEVLIEKVFQKIQNGPFKELKDAEIVNAFEHAKSKDFEVCVVATMSAGKSTLINALLGKQLLPSKQEACTAIITRIKDTEDTKGWRAQIYDQDNNLMETNENLDLETMKRLNDDKRVSAIKINGDIPFVSAEEESLVLIDTPGPNNSRDPEHKKIQSSFLNKSSKSLVLYIMEAAFGSDDDNSLLQRVADSMQVGGKQSKDRFIFVVNKLDGRSANDEDTQITLDNVRTYLEGHGILNPNIFPATALQALNIRMIQNGENIDIDTQEDTDTKIRKLNRNEFLHLENYSKLPTSVREEIQKQVELAKAQNNSEGEALIHTGIVSIESAIRQYVQKYAKTAKIKNVVDTFMHKLDEVDCFERTIKELDKNREESGKIISQIEMIKGKIDNADTAKKFEEDVEDAVVKMDSEANRIINQIVQKFQAQLTKKIDKVKGKELSINEVHEEVQKLTEFAKKLEPDFNTEIEQALREKLLQNGNELLQQYKQKLILLTEEIPPSSISKVVIDPVKLIGASITIDNNFSAENLIQHRQEKDGEKWVKNTDKKWYKPWTWFQEGGYYQQLYKTVDFVSAEALAQEFFAPIKESIYNNGDSARLYAEKQANRISKKFKAEFERLDKVLKNKLSELEDVASDRKKAEARVAETEKRLAWLNEIKVDVSSILDI